MGTKKVYVIGTHVNKSLSPIIFNHWFKKYNINAKYYYKTVKENNFNKDINKILKEKDLCGINITIPFKEKIIKKIHRLDKHAKIIGAVNCVTIKNNKYYGSNTDWLGFGESFLNTNINKNILKDKISKNNKTILIGYGGAAKAILYCLTQMGYWNYKNTIVFNRTERKIYIPKSTQLKTFSLKKISDYIDDARLIINTTPGNVLEDLKIKKIKKRTAVCDIVYKPKETKFLSHFTRPEAKIYGIEMLVNQAKPCFYTWFGIMPVVDENLTKKISKIISQ